jgi:WD40 repeat protein/tRNA A-37 threonylcarbamoyl transferase component Bud32
MDAWRTPDVDTLPLTTEQWLDEVCLRFEASWETAGHPSIESHLAGSAGIDRLALLRELVLIDISCRVAANEKPRLEEYSNRFTELDPAWLQEQINQASGTAIFSWITDPDASTSDGLDHSREIRPTPCFNDFDRLERLGGGGMGVVYRARQKSVNRIVALKMIRSGQLASTTEMQRFRAESEAAAQLDHPNIVPVYEVGEHDGQPYFSMKYVDGPSLASALASGEWAARTKGRRTASAELTATTARAVHHAHQRGVLHRDLKPANILLQREATASLEFTPIIADFGLARRLASNAAATQTGAVVGTPSYMSPEQALSRKDLSIAVDVYGLGAILYELLTGEPPFRSDSALETIQRVIAEEPRRPSSITPDVDPELEVICLRCLQKEPGQRYASALALAEDLERWLAGEPIAARRITRRERVWRWCRRNPGWAGMTSVVAILLLTISVGGLILNVELRDAVEQSEKRRKEAEGAERARREQLLQSNVAEAQAKRFSQRIGQRFGTLEAVARAANLARELDKPSDQFDSLRNLAIAAMALPDSRAERELAIAPSNSVDLGFDDRLELYAHGDSEGLVTVRRFGDDTLVGRWQGVPSRTTVDFGCDDDGPFLVIRNGPNQSLLTWRFGASDPVPLGNISSKGSNGLCWTADNHLLIFVDADGSMPVIDLPSGALQRRIHFRKWRRPPEAQIPTYIRTHPFEHRVAVAACPENDPDNTVHVINLDNGDVSDFAVAPASPVFSVNWSADGKLLVVGHEMELVFWDVASHRIVHRLSDRKGEAISARINSAGDGMTTRSLWGGGLKYWHPFALKPQLLVPDFNGDVSTTADGRFVCSTRQGDRLSIATIAPAREMRTLAVRPKDEPVGELRGLTCHPAGRLLAVGSASGVYLFDLETGFEVGKLDIGHNWGVQFVAGTGELLTYGMCGMYRWPVRMIQEAPAKMKIGPPVALPIRRPNYDCFVAASRDGSTIAAGLNNGAALIHGTDPDKVVPLEPVEFVRQQISVNADGRWVATGVHGGASGDTRIWDGATGKLIKELGIGGGYALNFSPDGKWLSVDNRIFRTGTWAEQKRELRAVYRFCAFSPDSRLLATDRGNGAVRLEQVGTWKELALLENPSQGRCAYFCFTGDGTKLIALNTDDQVVHVWDLQLIRANLSRLGLDWNEPPYTVEEKKLNDKRNRALEIEIVGVESIGNR